MNLDTDVFLKTLGQYVRDQIGTAVKPFIEQIQKNNDLITAQNLQLAALQKRFDDMPVPVNGKDGVDGKDGKDADMSAVDDALHRMTLAAKEWTQSYVNEAIAELPKPEKGEKGEKGDPGVDGIGIEGKRGDKGDDGMDGKDGADVIGAIIDRAGDLVLTLSNGVVKNVGAVVGKDGKDGAQGIPGKDGRDGFGFEDFKMLFDGERTYTYVFEKGDQKKEFTFTHKNVLFQGIWRDGKYQCGDCVSYDGGMWIALEETSARPGTEKSGWQLAVRRGREGKQGPSGAKGDIGPRGPEGKVVINGAGGYGS